MLMLLLLFGFAVPDAAAVVVFVRYKIQVAVLHQKGMERAEREKARAQLHIIRDVP